MTTLARLLSWYEQLSPDSVGQIKQFYHPICYFKDPFNEFSDRAQLEQLFARMFIKVQKPRFVIVDTVSENQSTFIVWQFHFMLRQRPLHINGSSHLRFDESGLIVFHRDYWDAAEELYEKLPLIGFVLKQLKKINH